MLVAYRVVEDIYQGLHGMNEIGLFELPDGLTKEEIEKECNEYCSPLVEDIIISYGLEEEYEDEECWSGDWTCYKVRDDVMLSEVELDNLLCNLGFEIFTFEYCINEDLTY